MAAVQMKLVKELRDRTNVSLADCKKAIEKYPNDIEAAIDLLKQWGSLKAKAKAKENIDTAEGIVLANISENLSTAAIVEIGCQTDFAAKSEEFIEFANKTVATIIEFGNADKMVDEKNALVFKTGENISIKHFDLLKKTSPYSLFTTYEHPGNKLCSLVETQASSEEIFNSKYFREFSFNVAMQVAAMDPLAISEDQISEEDVARQLKIFEAQLAEDNKPIVSWTKILEGKFAKWKKENVLLEQVSIRDSKNKTIASLLKDLNEKLNGTVSIVRFKRYNV